MQFSATFVILNKRLPRQIAIRTDRDDVRGSFFPTGESREENSRGFQLSLGSNGYATELILHNLSKLNHTCPFRRWIYLKIPLK